MREMRSGISFSFIGKVRLKKQKRFVMDVHLAEKRIIALQFRTGAKEPQVAL